MATLWCLINDHHRITVQKSPVVWTAKVILSSILDQELTACVCKYFGERFARFCLLEFFLDKASHNLVLCTIHRCVHKFGTIKTNVMVVYDDTIFHHDFAQGREREVRPFDTNSWTVAVERLSYKYILCWIRRVVVHRTEIATGNEGNYSVVSTPLGSTSQQAIVFNFPEPTYTTGIHNALAGKNNVAPTAMLDAADCDHREKYFFYINSILIKNIIRCCLI